MAAAGISSCFYPGVEALSWPFSYIFQDVGEAVWAFCGRAGTTSEATEKWFQRADWFGAPSSHVSEVKQYYFTLCVLSVSIWATTALVAKCSDMIGHICTSGSEKSEKLSLVWKSKFCKFLQQSSVCVKSCTKNSPRYIFNKRKTRRGRNRPFWQIKQGLQIMLCNYETGRSVWLSLWVDECNSSATCLFVLRSSTQRLTTGCFLIIRPGSYLWNISKAVTSPALDQIILVKHWFPTTVSLSVTVAWCNCNFTERSDIKSCV